MVSGEQRSKAETQDVLEEITLCFCLQILNKYIPLRCNIILSVLTGIHRHHFEIVTLKDNM